MVDNKELTGNIDLILKELGVRGSDNTAFEIKKIIASEDKFREATNSTIPEVLNALAKDPNDIVRARVAGNTATSTDDLILLSRDLVKEVKLEVAKNPSSLALALDNLLNEDDDILIELAKHENISVGCMLKLADTTDIILIELLDNVKLAADALDKISSSVNIFVLLKVAMHKNTPESALVRMVYADINDEYVFIELASRVDMLSDLLAKLAQSEFSTVRKAVMNNPNTPAGIRRSLRIEFV